MEIASLPKVECVVLHNQFKPLDNDAIFNAVQMLSANLNFAPEVQLMDSSSATEMHVHVGGHRVLISQNSCPLEVEEFKKTLTTPYTNMVLPGAHDIVHSHQAYTVVTVVRGLFDLTPEAMLFRDSNSDSNCFNTREEAFQAMVFCCELVKHIIENNPASALHWQPSDNLIPQDFFERNCDGDLMLLNLRPYFVSSTGRIAKGLPLGMELTGSQWLVGRMIEFEEAAVSFPWMMEAVLAFITLCQTRGSVLPHMDTFGLEGQKWRVRVVHEEGNGADSWKKVKLFAAHVPEFGILGDADIRLAQSRENRAFVRDDSEAKRHEIEGVAKRLYDEPNKLNPDDMMDLAILEQLRKRQAADWTRVGQTLPAAVAADDVTQPEEVFDFDMDGDKGFHPPREPWIGSAKKADLDALRELANVGLDSKADGSNDEQDEGSLLDKLGGVFGIR